MARVLVVLLIWLCLGVVTAQEAQVDRVLVLHAYHPAMWTDELNRGIRSVLQGRDPIEFHIEYMDTKREKSEAYLESLRASYAQKWRQFSFDVVLTSDNTALDFALTHQEQLLGGAPIVFCGVNRFAPAMIAGSPQVTGVIEQGDFLPTLEWALAARPATKRLIMISDGSSTGLLNAEALQTVVRESFPAVETQSTKNFSFAELGQLLATPDDQAIAFFVAFWQDGAGQSVSPDQLQTAFEGSSIPIFGRSEWMIQKGMAGGMCVSGFAQGSTAAHLALRILNGEPAQSIPVVTKSPNIFMFDYAQLQRHGLQFEPLPAGAIVVNEPTQLLNIDRSTAYLLAALLIALLMACIAMAAWVHSLDRQRRMTQERDLYFDASLDMLCIINGDGIFLEINQAWEQTLGWSKDEMIGRYVLDFIHPDDHESTLAVVGQVFGGDDLVGYVNHYRTKSGEYRVFSWTASPLPDSKSGAGDRRRGFGIARDVTEERRLQEELHQSQKLESIGRLAGGIAHDFNNLLTGMMGGSEMLLERANSLPQERRHDIYEMIHQSANRAAELTQQLLTIGRKSQGQRELLDLSQLVREVVTILQASIDRKIEIVTDLSDQPLVVSAERGPLHAAVLNLGVNARDEMVDGGRVTLTTALANADTLKDIMPDLPAGQYAVLTVRDTGAGINPAVCGRIFEPFFTTKKVGEGTGLGLSATYSTVLAHNGRIHVDPGPGTGACFTICLPLNEEAQVVAVSGQDELVTGSGTILIIDDEPSIRDAASAMLERLGYTVLVASSGSEGVACYQQHQAAIDLVMLDLVMPDQSGHQIFGALVEIDSNVRVMLSSGFDLVGGQAEAMMDRPQAVGFLEKPFTMNRLSQIVAGALAIISK